MSSDGTIDIGIGNIDLEWYDDQNNPLREDFVFEKNKKYHSTLPISAIMKVRDVVTVKGYTFLEKVEGDSREIVDVDTVLPERNVNYVFHFDIGENDTEIKNYQYMCDMKTEYLLNGLEQGRVFLLEITPVHSYSLIYDSNTANKELLKQNFTKDETVEIKENNKKD